VENKKRKDLFYQFNYFLIRIPESQMSMQIRIRNIDSYPLFRRCDPVAVDTESLNYCPVCGFRFAEKKNEILQHFTTCLAAKFRLEKRQPGGNLRYRSCSI
jgi:hypothetical protein